MQKIKNLKVLNDKLFSKYKHIISAKLKISEFSKIEYALSREVKLVFHTNMLLSGITGVICHITKNTFWVDIGKKILKIPKKYCVVKIVDLAFCGTQLEY